MAPSARRPMLCALAAGSTGLYLCGKSDGSAFTLPAGGPSSLRGQRITSVPRLEVGAGVGAGASSADGPSTSTVMCAAAGLAIVGALARKGRKENEVARRAEAEEATEATETIEPEAKKEDKKDKVKLPFWTKPGAKFRYWGPEGKEVDIPEWMNLGFYNGLTASLKKKAYSWLVRYFDADGNVVAPKGKEFSVAEAVRAIIGMCERSPHNRDETVEVMIRLNLDSKFPDQQVRTQISIPHGTGKSARVAVFCGEDEEQEVMDMGAAIAGTTLSEAIKNEDIDFDVLIAKPQMMPQLARLGKVLGPLKLMPSPKSGTVVQDYKAAIDNFTKGTSLELRMDNYSQVIVPCGKISMGEQKLVENVRGLLDNLAANKPPGAKSDMFKMVYIGSSKSPTVKLANSELPIIVGAEDDSDDDE